MSSMLDIDENTSVEDDMFENVKTDEDMDHEMEEEEGGSAFEEEIDPDESDQQEQAVIPKSQTPFLSDKDTPESYGELIGFMEKFIEDQKAENDAFRKEVIVFRRGPLGFFFLASGKCCINGNADGETDELASVEIGIHCVFLLDSVSQRAGERINRRRRAPHRNQPVYRPVQTNRYPTRVRLDRSSSYASSYAS